MHVSQLAQHIGVCVIPALNPEQIVIIPGVGNATACFAKVVQDTIAITNVESSNPPGEFTK